MVIKLTVQKIMLVFFLLTVFHILVNRPTVVTLKKYFEHFLVENNNS